MLTVIVLGESSIVIYGDQENDYNREGYCKEDKELKAFCCFSQ